ncbi:maltokinase N-terminal cap-like domain-containing protein [Streptomyces lushanensis]|uniref:maltokinase N-terminal cap-like domain-containing protein n=1 Tax=Streptomyces lushanensis TaxID=1434255 RepID=UPI00082D4527|nr:1,4-alpha-glucan branching protein [Streptomyces lushanensis]
MAVIHRTTLAPSKLELLAPWLPAQPWYLGNGREPELTKVGGFRLDDPEGEVGMEFMVIADGSGDQPVAYHVPLTYRGAPLDDAGQALIGTTEHGVLGRRWVYDGTHDPVLVAQLFALMTGVAEPQAQSTSNSPDPTVTGHFEPTGHGAPVHLTAVTDGAHGTDLLIRTTTTARPASPAGHLTIRVNRVLRPTADAPAAHAADALGHVTANWLLPDGSTSRGHFAAAHDTTPQAPTE